VLWLLLPCGAGCRRWELWVQVVTFDCTSRLSSASTNPHFWAKAQFHAHHKNNLRRGSWQRDTHKASCLRMATFSTKRRNGEASLPHTGGRTTTRTPYVFGFSIFFFTSHQDFFSFECACASYPPPQGPAAAGQAAHVGQPGQEQQDDSPSPSDAPARPPGAPSRVSSTGFASRPLAK
jgi:hypothetical protein